MKPTTADVIGDHRPELTDCTDRAQHERLLRIALRGHGQPAGTPIADRPDDGVQHDTACPHAGPAKGACLCGLIGGAR